MNFKNVRFIAIVLLAVAFITGLKNATRSGADRALEHHTQRLHHRVDRSL